jgi:hypothetical protein
MQALLSAAMVWTGLTVVHFGDSHVAAGLTAGLREHFQAQGARYYSDYWVSSSTVRWAYSDRLPDMLRRRRPDIVIVTLGSNEAMYPNLERYGDYMEKLIRRIGDRRCYWIGPPRYDRFDVSRIVEAQKAHVGRCRYFDSRGIDAPRGHTRLHFTREGGLVWAEAIWQWMNGVDPASDSADPPVVASIPQ